MGLCTMCVTENKSTIVAHVNKDAYISRIISTCSDHSFTGSSVSVLSAYTHFPLVLCSTAWLTGFRGNMHKGGERVS